jgi:peptide/nickel transport system substrate-binding protein
MVRDQFLPSRNLSRRTALRLLAASGAVALLAACRGAGPAPISTAATSPTQGTSQASGVPAGGATKTGGTLNVALSDLGNENLDVILASTNNHVIYLMHERLMLYNEQGELIPWLAESWQMSEDGRQWTFKLRTGG